MIAATITKQPSGSWLFEWDATTPPYSIWLDGELLATVEDEEEYEFSGVGYGTTPPALEIVDATETADNETHPPFARIQWRTVPGTFIYAVEQYVGSDWVRAVLVHENGAGYYLFTTPILEDGSANQWRIRAMDAEGNYGDSVSFDFTMITIPDALEVEMEYDAEEGEIIVSEVI